jgi:hypothetical protein
MEFPEIGAVTFRNVVGPVVAGLKIGVDAASRVAVETELLIMAVRTVLVRLTRDQTVAPGPVRVVVRGDALASMALRAFL